MVALVNLADKDSSTKFFQPPTEYGLRLNNLNMVIMIRDPREVIAEIMFWRGKPVNKNLRKRKFYHSFISWLLSIKTSIRLIKKYPDRVKVIFFNKLVNQINFEILGTNDIAADLELILLGDDILKSILTS